MRAPHIALIGLLAVAGSAIGAFGGNWAWRASERLERARERQAAASAAELERASPRGQQREKMSAHLNDPDSAVFKDDHRSPIADHIWCGRINAKNRMGALTGFTIYAYDMARDHMMVLQDSPIGDEARGRQSEFLAVWKIYCDEKPAPAGPSASVASR